MIMRSLNGFIAATALVFAAQSAGAHDGVTHETSVEAQQHLEATVDTAGFPDIKGGDFNLVDHNGEPRTSRDPKGNHQLVFFGYASCKAICDVALPRMAEAVDRLKLDEFPVTPILISVDPERDTVENIGEAVKRIHPDMIGLTGSETALNQAYKAFQIEKSLVYDHPDEGPIYAHGSFIYLLGPDGDFKTLFPPILSSERIAEITTAYITGKK